MAGRRTGGAGLGLAGDHTSRPGLAGPGWVCTTGGVGTRLEHRKHPFGHGVAPGCVTRTQQHSHESDGLRLEHQPAPLAKFIRHLLGGFHLQTRPGFPHLIDTGLIDSPPLVQVCLGLAWSAGADTASMLAMTNALPADANWFSFGPGNMQMPMAAQAMVLGGNVRVGLEDNLYLKKGVLASNGQLVEKAAHALDREPKAR